MRTLYIYHFFIISAIIKQQENNIENKKKHLPEQAP